MIFVKQNLVSCRANQCANEKSSRGKGWPWKGTTVGPTNALKQNNTKVTGNNQYF